VAETTPRRREFAVFILTTGRLYLNSPSNAPKNLGQINSNLNDYHSNLLGNSRTFWIPDITHGWHQQEKTHSKYADHSNVAGDIYSIIPYGVRVEASISLGRHVIGWRQTKTTGETLQEKVIVRQCVGACISIVVCDHVALNTRNSQNPLEMLKEVEKRKLYISANVHDFWEMWQGSQNLRATKMKSHPQSSR
jgi:hypothetical protein